jgi:hypothetical protein
MGASFLPQPYPEPESSLPESGRDEARQEDGGLGAPSSLLPPPAAPPGPRSLAEWRRQKVADLAARFPDTDVWRDDAASTYRATGPWCDLENPDIHLLGVHMSVEREARP